MLLRVKDYFRIYKSAFLDVMSHRTASKKSNKRLVSLLHRSDQLHYELKQVMKDFRTEFKIRVLLDGEDDNVVNLDSDTRIKLLFKELGLDDSDIIYHKDSSTQFSRYYSWVNKNLFKTDVISNSDNHFNRVYDYLKNPLVYMQNRVVSFDTKLWRPVEDYFPYLDYELNMDAYIDCPKCHAWVEKENLVSCICGHVFNEELVTILSDSNSVIERKIQYGRDKFRYEIVKDGKVYEAEYGLIQKDYLRDVIDTDIVDSSRVFNVSTQDDMWEDDGWSGLPDWSVIRSSDIEGYFEDDLRKGLSK